MANQLKTKTAMSQATLRRLRIYRQSETAKGAAAKRKRFYLVAFAGLFGFLAQTSGGGGIFSRWRVLPNPSL